MDKSYIKGKIMFAKSLRSDGPRSMWVSLRTAEIFIMDGGRDYHLIPVFKHNTGKSDIKSPPNLLTWLEEFAQR